MKLKEILIGRDKKAKDLAIEIGTDEPMISKFANYKCLPTPKDMEKILKSLDCKLSDIYKDDEIYYKSKKKQPKTAEEADFYNLCVRLENEARNILASKNLKRFGYRDKTDWLTSCYETFKEKVLNEKARSENQHENEPR